MAGSPARWRLVGESAGGEGVSAREQRSTSRQTHPPRRPQPLQTGWRPWCGPWLVAGDKAWRHQRRAAARLCPECQASLFDLSTAQPRAGAPAAPAAMQQRGDACWCDATGLATRPRACQRGQAHALADCPGSRYGQRRQPSGGPAAPGPSAERPRGACASLGDAATLSKGLTYSSSPFGRPRTGFGAAPGLPAARRSPPVAATRPCGCGPAWTGAPTRRQTPATRPPSGRAPRRWRSCTTGPYAPWPGAPPPPVAVVHVTRGSPQGNSHTFPAAPGRPAAGCLPAPASTAASAYGASLRVAVMPQQLFDSRRPFMSFQGARQPQRRLDVRGDAGGARE